MKKVLVGSLLIVTLAIGVTGGTVLAQSADEEGGVARTLADRVAEILGLDSATVADAIEQAKNDMVDERIGEHLAAAVESGRLTQEQADAQLEWLQSRPEGVGPSFGFGFRGHKFGRGGHMRGGFRGHFGGGFGSRFRQSEPVAPAPDSTSL
jgi:hypothetical protein